MPTAWLLFATSSNDLIYMLEAPIPELAVCGLQLNSAKTKILTTSPSESPEFVDVYGEMVQVIHAETVHKYFGRHLSGNFLARRNSEFAYRWQIAFFFLGTNLGAKGMNESWGRKTLTFDFAPVCHGAAAHLGHRG